MELELAANPYEFFEPYFTLWASSSGVDLNVDGRGQTIARIVDNVSWSTEKRLREEAKWTDWHRTCVDFKGGMTSGSRERNGSGDIDVGCSGDAGRE